MAVRSESEAVAEIVNVFRLHAADHRAATDAVALRRDMKAQRTPA